MEIVIVGGGIAGLAAAVALGRHGHGVTVLEQAEEFGDAGSGLSLWPNALRALDALGVGEDVRRRARTARGPVIRDHAGRALSRTDVRELERRFGALVMIHRADLLDTLRSAVPGPVLHAGCRVISVDPDGAVRHSEGATRADLVIGADGINSVVRTATWPAAQAPRFAGYGAYRMLTRPIAIDDEGESWGRGTRFGYLPLADGRVYCFAVVNTKNGAVPEPLDKLRERFAGWHGPIPALLAAVPEGAVIYHDLYELPPLDSFVSGGTALVGDAAHAMTPNLGQGACQAIEDAVTLAAALASHASLPAALAAYDRCRRPRTQAITARSRRLGRIGQWESRLAVAVRDQLVRLTPDRAALRSLEPVLSWQPPEIASTTRPTGE